LVANALTGIKNALAKCLHFQSQLNTLVFLSVLTDEKSKGQRSGEREGCTSKTKCLRTRIYTTFFSFFGVIDN
jgi:hypothetical protein